MYALVLAEVDNVLLRQKRVVLDLVCGGYDCRLREQLLHVLVRVICDADGLDFIGVLLDEFLHVLPCVNVRDAVVDVAGAVFEFGEERVVSYKFLSASTRYLELQLMRTLGVHGNRPMNKIKVHVRSLKHVQALLQSFFGASVECAPELAGNEELFTLHDTARNDILECFTDFILVLVAECAVDVSVARLNGMHNSFLHLSRRRLPRSQS
jgi:hypothetical protein